VYCDLSDTDEQALLDTLSLCVVIITGNGSEGLSLRTQYRRALLLLGEAAVRFGHAGENGDARHRKNECRQ
jgi:hypothetical protein